MRYSSAFAAIAALLAASVISAAPSVYNIDQTNGALLTDHRVSNPEFKESSAPTVAGTARALAKYEDLQPDRRPPKVRYSPVRGTVIATAVSSYRYVCPVDFGTPPQTLNMLFDTGSSDTWVFSSTTDPRYVQGQKTYHPELSVSAIKQEGWHWKITYGGGSSASGGVYRDTVTVGGLTSVLQTIQTVVVFKQARSPPAFSGIFGLASSEANSIRPGPQRTVLDQISWLNLLPPMIFAVDFQLYTPGTIDFGFINNTKYFKPLTYVPTIIGFNGLWAINIDRISIDGVGIVSGQIGAIVDTGAPFIYLPDNIVQSYYSKVKGARKDDQQGGYVFDCKTEVPWLRITISEYTAIISNYYIAHIDLGNGLCLGGIQGGLGRGFVVLGNAFITTSYIVFDSELQQIGFASKRIT